MEIDKYLVINLDRSTDRLNQAIKQFQKENITNWVRIKAYDGKIIDQQIIDQNTTRFCSKFCTKSSIGCAMSHIKAWKYVIDNNLNNVVIFEDDFVMYDNFKKEFNKILKHVPKNYDIVYLGYFDFIFPISLFTKNNKKQINNTYLFTPNEGIGSTIAYMISNAGAKKLLSCITQEKIYQHIDFELNNKCFKDNNLDINVYACKNKLIEAMPNVEGSTNIASPRPYFLNNILDKIKTKNYSLGYMFSTSIYQIHGYDINLYRIIFILIVISLSFYKNNKNKSIILQVFLFLILIDIFYVKNIHDLNTLIIDGLIFTIPLFTTRLNINE